MCDATFWRGEGEYEVYVNNERNMGAQGKGEHEVCAKKRCKYDVLGKKTKKGQEKTDEGSSVLLYL